MNIILYGLRGTGKTTLGRRLAEKLNRKFIDTDKERLNKFNETAEVVVKRGGWPLFRQQEKEITLEIAKKFDNAIISVGGGTMMDEENAAALKKNGKAVFLRADVATLVRRITGSKNPDKSNRPALVGGKTLEQEVEEVWQQRKDVYSGLADLVINVNYDNLDQKIQKIIDYLNLCPKN